MSVWDKVFDLFLCSLVINGVACLCDGLPIYPLSGGFVWFFLLVGYGVLCVVERKRNEAKLSNSNDRCPNCDSRQVMVSNHADYWICGCCGWVWKHG